MPMNFSTWKKAESRYQEMGMSKDEIEEYRKAWEKKHKNMKPSPKMLGKGLASGAAKKLLKHKSKLQQLEQELEGKEF